MPKSATVASWSWRSRKRAPPVGGAKCRWEPWSSVTGGAAGVGKAHELKGQAISAFVTVKEGVKPSAELRDDLREHVAKKIGAIAKPDDILFSADLPKTRSGKIMRRLLKDIAEGRALGDTTTLADPNVVARLKEMYEDKE